MFRSVVPSLRKRGVPADLLAGGATLEASALQHLLVLLLPHALTALLDERSHEAVTLLSCREWCETSGGPLVGHDSGGEGVGVGRYRGLLLGGALESSEAGTRTPNGWTKTSSVANYTTPEGRCRPY